MSTKRSKLTRKNFIKGLGATALAASVPKIVQGGTGHFKNKKNKLHKIVSANIRVALDRDIAKGHGWEKRKEICFEVLHAQKPDIICFQEVISPQMADLEKNFPEYIGFGFAGPAMDAYEKGYHGIAKNPIMFSKKRYQIVSGGTYWLSETPLLAGSISWGSARPRHVNWIRLRDKSSRKAFRVLSTHLDHASQHARKQQARMIVEESEQYQLDFPQLLAGDFNQDASNVIIDIIKEGGWIKDKGGWNDTYSIVHGPEDPGFTYHGFEGTQYTPKEGSKGKIDFIFSRGKMKVKNAKIIKSSHNGLYPSDHFFISTEVSL